MKLLQFVSQIILHSWNCNICGKLFPNLIKSKCHTQEVSSWLQKMWKSFWKFFKTKMPHVHVYLQRPEVAHEIHPRVLQLRHKLDVEVGELVEDLGLVKDAQALRPVVVDDGVIWLDIRCPCVAWCHFGEKRMTKTWISNVYIPK